MLEVTGYLKLN